MVRFYLFDTFLKGKCQGVYVKVTIVRYFIWEGKLL